VVTFVPGPCLRAGHRALSLQRVEVEHASEALRDHRVGHALLAISAVSARVSMPERPMTPRRLSQWSKAERIAVVRRRRDRRVQITHRRRASRQVDRLDILVVGADIAGYAEREGDDLPA